MYILMCLSRTAYGSHTYTYTLDMQFESDILLITATWANANILSADERVFDHSTKMAFVFKHSGHHAKMDTQYSCISREILYGNIYVCAH